MQQIAKGNSAVPRITSDQSIRQDSLQQRLLLPANAPKQQRKYPKTRR
jgi:hypothetical protein